MAKFILKGAGEFPFDPNKLLNTEAMLLEKVTGHRLGEIVEDFNARTGPLGLTAFLWLAMRRNGHHVKFAELEFDFADIEYIRTDEDTASAEAEQSGPTEVAVAPTPPPSARKTAAGSKKK